MSTPSTSKSASPAPAPEEDHKDELQEKTEGVNGEGGGQARKEDRDASEKEGEREGEEGEETKQQGAEDEKGEGVDMPALHSAAGVLSQGDWQAIWSAQHNLYYFHNTRTNETTWTNPLDDGRSQGNAHASSSQQQQDPVAAALAAGIDPELAYLDPTLVVPAHAPEAGTFQARFNARTGAFTAPEARDPTHLGEWERAQRMSSVYFDTAAYDEEVQRRKAQEEEEGNRKRKRVSKKDLDRFKEQKRLKKIAKTAWLRT